MYYYIIAVLASLFIVLAGYYLSKKFAALGIIAMVLLSTAYFGASYESLSISAIMLLAFGVMYSYGSIRMRIFYAGIFASVFLFTFIILLGVFSQFDTMAFGLGAIYGIIFSGAEANRHRTSRTSIKTEIDRDYIQIAAGFVVLLAIILWHELGIYASFYLVLIGILTVGIVRNSKSKFLSTFRELEKDGVFFGRGAIFLGIGFTILESLYQFHGIALFGMVILLFCDPTATIIGIKFGRKKLPYSSKKSYAGTLSYFILGAVFAIPLVGYIGIPIALLFALVESVGSRIDDNIAVAFIYGIVGTLLA